MGEINSVNGGNKNHGERGVKLAYIEEFIQEKKTRGIDSGRLYFELFNQFGFEIANNMLEVERNEKRVRDLIAEISEKDINAVIKFMDKPSTQKAARARKSRARKSRPEKTHAPRAGSARTEETIKGGREEFFRRGEVKEPGKAKIRKVKLPKLW